MKLSEVETIDEVWTFNIEKPKYVANTPRLQIFTSV